MSAKNAKFEITSDDNYSLIARYDSAGDGYGNSAEDYTLWIKQAGLSSEYYAWLQSGADMLPTPAYGKDDIKQLQEKISKLRGSDAQEVGQELQAVYHTAKTTGKVR